MRTTKHLGERGQRGRGLGRREGMGLRRHSVGAFPKFGFRVDLAPEKNRFRFGHKRAGPKTKAKLPNGTEEMASLRARSMAGPIPTPAELDEVFRGDHAGTLLAARAHFSEVGRSARKRCVPIP